MRRSQPKRTFGARSADPVNDVRTCGKCRVLGAKFLGVIDYDHVESASGFCDPRDVARAPSPDDSGRPRIGSKAFREAGYLRRRSKTEEWWPRGWPGEFEAAG